LLVYADDVNLLGDNTDTLRKNTETLVDGSKEVEVNAEKPKYTLISHHPSAGQNHDNIANRCSENVTFQIFVINSNKSNKFRKKLRGS
jgi:ABC-type siderophore export system fused ATPase/permease subunit